MFLYLISIIIMNLIINSLILVTFFIIIAYYSRFSLKIYTILIINKAFINHIAINIPYCFTFLF